MGAPTSCFQGFASFFLQHAIGGWALPTQGSALKGHLPEFLLPQRWSVSTCGFTGVGPTCQKARGPPCHNVWCAGSSGLRWKVARV